MNKIAIYQEIGIYKMCAKRIIGASMTKTTRTESTEWKYLYFIQVRAHSWCERSPGEVLGQPPVTSCTAQDSPGLAAAAGKGHNANILPAWW